MPLLSEKEIFLAIPTAGNNTQSTRYNTTRISRKAGEETPAMQANHPCKGSDCRIVKMQLQSENKRIAEKFTNKPIKSKLCSRHPEEGAQNLFQPTEKIN